LYEEELVLLKPSPIRQRTRRIGQVSVAELEKLSFLLYPARSNMRRQIDHFFASLGLQPRVVMEADDTEAIKRLVETGFGCSILPISAVSKAGSFYQVFRVQGQRLTRQQALAMVDSPYPRALTESIAESLQALLLQEDARRQ
jgi:DNA-binding transcriptional LysR family regulator